VQTDWKNTKKIYKTLKKQNGDCDVHDKPTVDINIFLKLKGRRIGRGHVLSYAKFQFNLSV
jgi:hypothetical protein